MEKDNSEKLPKEVSPLKPATISYIKQELKNRSPEEVVEFCLRMTRFKKENKELLTYLLFDSHNEPAYLNLVKQEMDRQFAEINMTTIYFVKKSVRKILRTTQKYIRYSGQKQTEVALLLHFCRQMKDLSWFMNHSTALHNIYLRQVQKIEKTVGSLHEDLQFDYQKEVEALRG
jgi:hypothetical protein